MSKILEMGEYGILGDGNRPHVAQDMHPKVSYTAWGGAGGIVRRMLLQEKTKQ
jgi:hypothetical protein